MSNMLGVFDALMNNISNLIKMLDESYQEDLEHCKRMHEIYNKALSSHKPYIAMHINMLFMIAALKMAMALALRFMQLQVIAMKQHVLAIENLHRLWNVDLKTSSTISI